MKVLEERPNAYLALFGFAVAVAFVGAVSSAVTVPGLAGWYHALARPAWTPPDSVFGPVWTALYVLMGLAAWAVWRRPASPVRTMALALWWLQLALNMAWAILFFGQHLLGLALADAVLLAALVLGAIVAARQLAPGAAWLLAPNLAWVFVAIRLNAAILSLNS